MGETSAAFKDLTAQYAADIDAVCQGYEAEKQAIGEEIAPEVKEAVDKVKAAAEKAFNELLNLSKTYLSNIKELPEGEQPNQDVPQGGTQRVRRPSR
jgi:hypothetical protein